MKPTKAQQNYAKLIEKNDSNIQDQDRLRVQSSDKEALAQRSKEELDRQTKLFDKQNSTFYDEGLFQTFSLILISFKIEISKGDVKKSSFEQTSYFGKKS